MSDGKHVVMVREVWICANMCATNRNSWFPDGEGGKPWVDSSPEAPLQFWNGQDQYVFSPPLLLPSLPLPLFLPLFLPPFCLFFCALPFLFLVTLPFLSRSESRSKRKGKSKITD